MPAKLTVLIPCKDERQNIRGCIESARMVGDEILVADSGSQDGTLEIVRQMGGCRIIQREFISYSSFKNWAIPQARHSWVLVLDADERLSTELAAEILETLHQTPPPWLDGYWISFRSYLMGHPLRYCGYNTPAFRLFRRDACRYKDCRVHEEIEVDRRRASRLRGKIEHFSYWDYDHYLLKNVRYTKIGADERFRAGQRASWSSLLLRPALRFLHLYLVRGGFRDGLAGLQMCALMAFFNTFVKQARLWELQHGRRRPEPEPPYRGHSALGNQSGSDQSLGNQSGSDHSLSDQSLGDQSGSDHSLSDQSRSDQPCSGAPHRPSSDRVTVLSPPRKAEGPRRK